MKKWSRILAAAIFVVMLLPLAIHGEGELQNYCLNASVEVSSVEKEGTEGHLAVDGDMETRWASEYVDDAFITVDLGTPKAIGYIEIYWETATAADFVVEGSSDNSNWEHLMATVTDNPSGAVNEFEFDVVTARYIRVTCTKRATQYGNSIYELIARRTKDAVVSDMPAVYPSSGIAAPAGSVIITGELIGLEAGWGGNALAGRAAAFDGDVNTYFDPLSAGDGYCGVDAGKDFVLTKIAIHPRDGQAERFNGARIDGSVDGDEWVTIYQSNAAAPGFEWVVIEADAFFEDDPTYRYFRYFNTTSHGDVGEVELYGYAADGSTVIEAVTAPPAETDAPATETSAPTTAPAPQTFDFGLAAAAAAAASLAGCVLLKKKKDK